MSTVELNKLSEGYDLKYVMDVINAWRVRVITISSEGDLYKKIELIQGLSHEMHKLSDVLGECDISDFS